MALQKSRSVDSLSHSQVEQAPERERSTAMAAKAPATGTSRGTSPTNSAFSLQADSIKCLVASPCIKGCPTSRPGRPGSLPPPPTSAVKTASHQIARARSTGAVIGARVPRSGRCGGDRPASSQAPTALVCHLQARGRSSFWNRSRSVSRPFSAKAKRSVSAQNETSPYRRCKGAKSLLCPKDLPDGPLGGDLPLPYKGWWACKIDLKHAYFHLALHPNLRPYVCIQVAHKVFQFQGSAFGISTLPFWWTKIMQTFTKLWRSKGILCFVYLDDILVLGPSPQKVASQTAFMLKTLESAGMTVNQKKSVLTPTQEIVHLGFSVNLKEGLLQVPHHKLRSVKKDLGKVVVAKAMSPRKMSQVLGGVRSFLQAMPFLRAFTDNMLAFIQKCHQGWDVCHLIPQDLKAEVRELKTLLLEWKGRPLSQGQPVRTIHSDS